MIAELGDRHPGAAAIRVLVPSALPALPLDRARLRLLLRNLLDNSLRHSEATAPRRRPSCTCAGRTKRWRSMCDHGPGVPPEHLAQLAQAFYRPDSARQRATGGVGLGLYLPPGGAGAWRAAGVAQRPARAGGAGGAAGGGGFSG